MAPCRQPSLETGVPGSVRECQLHVTQMEGRTFDIVQPSPQRKMNTPPPALIPEPFHAELVTAPGVQEAVFGYGTDRTTAEVGDRHVRRPQNVLRRRVVVPDRDRRTVGAVYLIDRIGLQP